MLKYNYKKIMLQMQQIKLKENKNNMRNIKITYSYDGTNFFGLQRQNNTRTVQGVLEQTLMKYVHEEINLVSAGRTDTGVHAFMQVSNFVSNTPINLEKFKTILNNKLPDDISILNIEEVPFDFSSRFSVKERVYEYYFTNKKNPFINRFATYIPFEMDIKKLCDIMQILVGKHDFKNFRLADCSSKHQVREIFSIDYFEDSHKISEAFGIRIRGNAFLKSQIRIIVGTALDIYLGKKPANYFELMLTDLETDFSKKVAEPNGLFLAEIIY